MKKYTVSMGDAHFYLMFWGGLAWPTTVLLRNPNAISMAVTVLLEICMFFLMKAICFPVTPILVKYEIDSVRIIEKSMMRRKGREFLWEDAEHIYIYRPRLRIIGYVVLSKIPLTRRKIRKAKKGNDIIFIPIIGDVREKWKEIITKAQKL